MSMAGGLSFGGRPPPWQVVSALGVAQILAWGSSYYLLAVLARPIARDTGWPEAWVVGGLSIGLLVAGLAAPFVGRAIQRRGGRPILMASAFLMSGGLLLIGVAPHLIFYIAGWLIMGLGMGAGLYDAAFSTLGRTYGQEARRHITTLTIFGGFASTLCWPLTSVLLSEIGWRGACFIYAGIHLFIGSILYGMLLPKEPMIGSTKGEAGAMEVELQRSESVLFALTSASTALAAFISTVLSVHLLAILQDRGFSLSLAVALGAVVGPSQVGARVLEIFIGRRHHPIWTKVVSAILVGSGLSLLFAGMPLTAIALVFYGAGVGLESIARASLPLVVFGSSRYAPIMGRIARPSLVAKAAAPTLGALLLGALGPAGAVIAMLALAMVNVALVLTLIAWVKPGSAGDRQRAA